MKKTARLLASLTALASASLSCDAWASTCKDLPGYDELKKVLMNVKNDPVGNGGVPILGMWAVVMDSAGTVCAVANTEEGDLSVTAELAHRVFAAQKANTSNTFSSAKATTASGQLYTQALPGGTLFQANLNSQIDPWSGSAAKFGTAKDPMVGKRPGGFNAWAGGLGLYDSGKTKVGAIGVSGNSRCTDHVVAWKMRDQLMGGGLSSRNIPGGFSPLGNDALVLDVVPDPTGSGGPGYSPSGLGFPTSFCPNVPTAGQAGASIIFY